MLCLIAAVLYSYCFSLFYASPSQFINILGRPVSAITAVDSSQMMCEIYGTLLGRVLVPSNNIVSVTVFREVTNYFVDEKLVAILIMYLICLSL